MLTGRFGNTTGRPYLEGRLVFPKHNLRCDISFVVDTGADRTVLMPLDGARIGLDYGSLSTPFQTLGIGGYSADYVEDALVVFTDGTTLYVYTKKIVVSSPSPDIANIPSLLGRDILDHWRMSYDKANGDLTFDVLSADMEIPVPDTSA